MQGGSLVGILTGLPRLYGQETDIPLDYDMDDDRQLFYYHSPNLLHLSTPRQTLASLTPSHSVTIVNLITGT